MPAHGLAAFLVALARLPHLWDAGDLRGRDVPPRSVRGHALVAIGLDRDDVRTIYSLRLGQRGAQLRDRPHALGDRAETRGVRGEVDRERVALRSLTVEPERS